MKRLISILLLCALALSGCAATAPTPFEEAEAAAQPPREDNSAPGELVALNVQSGLVMWQRNLRNERSSYFANYLDTGSFYYERIEYIDMQNGTIRPICHIEGCAHDSPECEAFLPTNGTESWRLYNYGDMMFILYPSAWYDQDDLRTVTRPVGIDIADADGANRRTLISYDVVTQPAPYDTIPVSQDVGAIYIHAPLCDGRYLYYNLREITSVNYNVEEIGNRDSAAFVDSMEYDEYLITLDIATGKEASRVPFKNTLAVDNGYRSVYRGKPLFSGRKLDANGKLIQSANGREFTLCYYTVDYATGEVNPVVEVDVNMDNNDSDSGNISLLNGELYQVRRDEGALFRFEPDAGEFVKVFTAPEDWGIFSVETRGGRYLFFVWEDGGRGKYYVTDGFDEPLEEFTPYGFTGDINTWPSVGICGETESDFLMVTEWVDRELTAVNRDGDLVTEPHKYPIFALMSKEDYWNGVLNFRDITEVA